MCCTTLLPKCQTRLTTENSKFYISPSWAALNSTVGLRWAYLNLCLQTDVNVHPLLTVLRRSSARFSQTSMQHIKRSRATFRARTLRYQTSETSWVHGTLEIILITSPCLALFLSATSDVVFPSVGGLGSVPRPLPHQAAEHLPGSS